MALFGTVSPEMMQAARVVTGATFALWLGVGLVPPLRPYAWTIRVAMLTLYLAAAAAFVAYALL